MILIRLIILVFFWDMSCFGAITSEDIETERIVKALKNNSKVSWTLRPTIDVWNDYCPLKLSYQNIDWFLGDVCEFVLKSPACIDIPEEKKLDCNHIENTPQVNAWDFLAGCGKGSFKSMLGIISFTWGIIEWVWDSLANDQANSEIVEKSKIYGDALKLYLNTEYEKAYQQSIPPLKKIKAIKSMSESIGMLLINKISHILHKNYQEWGCVNFETKSELICEFIGQFVIPPAAFLAIIKKGAPQIKKSLNQKDRSSPSPLRNKSSSEKNDKATEYLSLPSTDPASLPSAPPSLPSSPSSSSSSTQGPIPIPKNTPKEK